MENKTEPKKGFFRRRFGEAAGDDQFTEEEVKQLEQELIATYLASPRAPVRTLLNMYRGYKKEIILSLIFYTIKTLPCIMLPIITANIINLVAERPEDFKRKMITQIVLMVIVLVQNIPTHMIHIRYYSIIARKVEAGLRGAMVRKLQQLSIPFHKEMQSGRIQAKIIRDVDTIQSLSSQVFSTLPGIVINLVTALVVVICNNLSVFFFFLLTIPCSVFAVRALYKPISRHNREFRQGMEEASASVGDVLEMAPITRAHALEELEVGKMTRILDSVAAAGFRLDMITSLFGSAPWVVFQLFQFACLLFSAYMAYKGRIGIGDIALYQSYFTTLTGQVSSIIGLMPAISKGFESVGSVGEILASVEIEDNTDKYDMEELRGEYEFKNVSFSYELGQPILRNVNLKIRAGETIAFVGESGSGKTTLLNLILGFNMPDSGILTIDGHDITQIDLHSYRRHLSAVPQNSVLFTGTIRENITYGLPSYSDEQLRQALSAACLTEFVDSLPDGVDTMLDEHGANLSGGQRQRLSIARAIIRDPDVIILDEATSALDSVSERMIQNAINNLAKGRTTFIVAHRLSTIKGADRIAVIRDGRCAEIGTYEELMARQGEFYKLRSYQQI